MSFSLEIVSPLRQVLAAKVSEVVLPAHDGEVGILESHENFVGMLGTGALKYVAESNDSWLMVSSGTYQVIGGKLIITAEVVEEAKDLDAERAKQDLAKLEQELSKLSANDAGYNTKKLELQRAKARLEVNRRMKLN